MLSVFLILKSYRKTRFERILIYLFFSHKSNLHIYKLLYLKVYSQVFSLAL